MATPRPIRMIHPPTSYHMSLIPVLSAAPSALLPPPAPLWRPPPRFKVCRSCRSSTSCTACTTCRPCTSCCHCHPAPLWRPPRRVKVYTSCTSCTSCTACISCTCCCHCHRPLSGGHPKGSRFAHHARHAPELPETNDFAQHAAAPRNRPPHREAQHTG